MKMYFYVETCLSLFVLVLVLALALALEGCSMGKSMDFASRDVNSAAGGLSGGPTGPAVAVPTSGAIVSRLVNGMQNSVTPTKGNFAKALAQVQTNLPKVTDPTKATGFDQVQLLVYAACSDLTAGTTPLMQSKYNVDPNSTVAANQANLVAAGVKILDQYTAGLASQGSSSAQVTAALTSLVSTLAADATTNTSKIAFMSVCMAANVTGSTLLGF